MKPAGKGKTASARPLGATATRAKTSVKGASLVRNGIAKSEAASRIDVGDTMPDATLLDQSGKPASIASLRRGTTVVYFYPKDDTPGCTREACAFQASLATLKRLSATVVGISPDSVARHVQFAGKYGLKFPLLSDETRNYARACGVLVPKTLYGRTSIGIERTTFLIDASGVIRRVWRKVRVDGHVDQVEQAIRELGSK